MALLALLSANLPRADLSGKFLLEQKEVAIGGIWE